MTNTTTPVENVEQLTRALGACQGRRDAMEEVIRTAKIAVDEHWPAGAFRPDRYARYLIERTDEFEVLALYWSPGQATAIHDHPGADGWVIGIEGEIEEQQFHATSTEPGNVRLEPGDRATLHAGEASFINDELALHLIRNTSDKPAITLHVYSPPIDVCSTYDPVTKSFVERQLAYDAPPNGCSLNDC